MDTQKKVLVFKTNLETEDGIRTVGTILDDHPEILKWNVDQLDIDKVLRIETYEASTPASIIQIVRNIGFDCAELPD